jgi:hypothetical protein
MITPPVKAALQIHLDHICKERPAKLDALMATLLVTTLLFANGVDGDASLAKVQQLVFVVLILIC